MSLTDYLTNIANAIRTKKGTTDKINAQDFATEIENLPSGETSEDGLIDGSIIDGSITEYTNNRVSDVKPYAFSYCQKLTSVSLPNAINIGQYAFREAYILSNVDLPNAENIDNSAFYQCVEFNNVFLPNVTSIGKYVFQNNGGMQRIHIPKLKSIGSGAFDGCFKLTSVIIEQTDSVCTLANTNAFTNCYHILGKTHSIYNPTGAKDGYIYVPDELVEQYKSATNWSNYADQIKPLNEYVEENV